MVLSNFGFLTYCLRRSQYFEFSLAWATREKHTFLVCDFPESSFSRVICAFPLYAKIFSVHHMLDVKIPTVLVRAMAHQNLTHQNPS